MTHGQEWIVYILRCGDGSFYAGITNNIARRISAHESGRGAKYTRGRGPLHLVCSKTFQTKADALREEYFIKGLTRLEKERYIQLASVD